MILFRFLYLPQITTLRFMNTTKFSIGTSRFDWQDAGFDLVSIRKAGVKCKLMTGTYMLQTTCARFKVVISGKYKNMNKITKI